MTVDRRFDVREATMTAPTNPIGTHPSIRSKGIFLLVVVVSLVPLTAVTSVVVDRFPTPYRTRVAAHLSEVVNRHADSVDRFIKNTRDTVRFLAETTDGEKLADSRHLAGLLDTLHGIHGTVFEDMGFVDDQGFQVAYAGPLKLAGARYAGAEWFAAAGQRPHTVSDVFTGLRGYPHFIVTAQKTWQGRTWILRATVDFNAFVSTVESLRLGETGRAFIVNRRGQWQTRPGATPLQVVEHLWRNGRDRQPSTENAFRQMADTAGENGGHIILTAPLNDGRWLLVFQQESADALLDLRRNIHTAGLVFVSGFVAIVFLAIYVGIRLEGSGRKDG